jgi:hypothetical protein
MMAAEVINFQRHQLLSEGWSASNIVAAKVVEPPFTDGKTMALAVERDGIEVICRITDKRTIEQYRRLIAGDEVMFVLEIWETVVFEASA